MQRSSCRSPGRFVIAGAQLQRLLGLVGQRTRVTDAEIDKYMARVDLPPKFVIPGGNQISAQLDLGRTILRRAERKVVSIQQAGELASTEGEVPRKLDPERALGMEIPKVGFDEPGFRWELNEDAMASEKLAEGIRLFAADTRKLEQFAHEVCHNC